MLVVVVVTGALALASAMVLSVIGQELPSPSRARRPVPAREAPGRRRPRVRFEESLALTSQGGEAASAAARWPGADGERGSRLVAAMELVLLIVLVGGAVALIVLGTAGALSHVLASRLGG